MYVIVTYKENKSFIFTLVGLQVFLGGVGGRGGTKGLFGRKIKKVGKFCLNKWQNGNSIEKHGESENSCRNMS